MTSRNNLIPGRMPLRLAWALAIAFVPLALIGIAYAAANTPADQPLFYGLMLGSLLVAPVAAWRTGRRWWLWLFMGVGAFLVSATLLGPFFQPITVAVAALFVERAPAGQTASPAVRLAPGRGGTAPTQGIGEGVDVPMEATADALPAQDEQAPIQRSAPRKPFRGHRRQRR